MTCKDCIHYEVCKFHGMNVDDTKLRKEFCGCFKGKEQIPKKPIPENRTSIGWVLHNDATTTPEERKFIDYHCPSCNNVVGEYFGSESPRTKDKIQWKLNFCGNCGLAIDWRMKDES